MGKYTIIDADTHVTETPDLWTSRAPASMRDRVPFVVTGADGSQRWVLGDGNSPLASVGMTATAGRGTFDKPPKTYADMHPGAYDANARLKYMDDMGIWAMVMYPNVGGFGAQQFLKLNDRELMLTCVQIYNDWQTEWASADSRRLLPITSIPFWDVNAAADEVRRCAALRQAAARRRALESAVGGGMRSRSPDQLPYRLGRHGRRHGQESNRDLRQDGDLHRTRSRHLSPQRPPTERPHDVRRARALSQN